MNTLNNDPTPSSALLAGVRVGISVALGEDSAAFGFSEDEMNRSIVRLSDVLLSAGANLVFGHDWRPNGAMAAVALLAARYSSESSESAPAPGQCRITNLVPWDRTVELPRELREDLQARGILEIIEIELPPALAAMEPDMGRRPLGAAALCILRKELAARCDARVCLGGKFSKFERFWPGILEEAWRSAALGKPVYLSKMLGGAARQVLEASQSNDWSRLVEPPSGSGTPRRPGADRSR